MPARNISSPINTNSGIDKRSQLVLAGHNHIPVKTCHFAGINTQNRISATVPRLAKTYTPIDRKIINSPKLVPSTIADIQLIHYVSVETYVYFIQDKILVYIPVYASSMLELVSKCGFGCPIPSAKIEALPSPISSMPMINCNMAYNHNQNNPKTQNV